MLQLNAIVWATTCSLRCSQTCLLPPPSGHVLLLLFQSDELIRSQEAGGDAYGEEQGARGQGHDAAARR